MGVIPAIPALTLPIPAAYALHDPARMYTAGAGGVMLSD